MLQRFRRYAILPLLLVAQIACQLAKFPSEIDLTPRSVTIEEQIEFGPGGLDLPDLRVGLAEASAYRSRLTLSFDGTQNGKPMKWSNTYTFAATQAPALSQLLIEEAGDDAGPPVLMGDYAGVSYEKRAEEMCLADIIDPQNAVVRGLEPAAQLPSLFGAEAAGSETLNGVPAMHYTFDERALGEGAFSKISGEVWLASEGGYVLRFHMNTTGDVGYFDQNTGGVLTYEYQLLEINTPLTIDVPADCPPGLVDAPMLPDAANVEKRPGLLQYDTTSTPADALAFYEQELPKLGWEPPAAAGDLPEGMTQEEYDRMLQQLQQLGLTQPTPTPDPSGAFLVFQQGDQMLYLLITLETTGTRVQITLSPSPK